MLTVRALFKQFPSLFKPALAGISFELQKGDFCILIGSNGSGKSTLLKAVSGEYRVDSGSVVFAGQDITGLPLHKRAAWISSVAQDTSKGTVQSMTLLENLSLSQMRGRAARYAFYGRKIEALEDALGALNLGLEGRLAQPMSTLSGGQQQMLATAMAILSNPALLLLDEHCSALDPKNQQKVMEYTAEAVAANGITTLMITHNLKDAIRYGNRLMLMHQGRLVMDLKAQDKERLSVQELLDYFHAYEDAELLQQSTEDPLC